MFINSSPSLSFFRSAEIMNLFKKQPYKISRDQHRVFVEWIKPIQEWSTTENETYLPALRKQIQKTVDDSIWQILKRGNPTSDPSYPEYVQKVRKQVIEEYSLEAIQDDVKIGIYHAGMLVISWPSEDFDSFPYYFRGIQLKPYKKAEPSAAANAYRRG